MFVPEPDTRRWRTLCSSLGDVVLPLACRIRSLVRHRRPSPSTKVRADIPKLGALAPSFPRQATQQAGQAHSGVPRSATSKFTSCRAVVAGLLRPGWRHARQRLHGGRCQQSPSLSKCRCREYTTVAWRAAEPATHQAHRDTLCHALLAPAAPSFAGCRSRLLHCSTWRGLAWLVLSKEGGD